MSRISAVVYDLEIVKAIPDKKKIHIPRIEYCKGWGDHGNMGISVLCAYDYVEDRYRTFCEDNKDEFANLIANRQVQVTFNGLRFDDKVIEAVWGIRIPSDNAYDVLREVWVANDLNPNSFSKDHGGFSLDACAETNFGKHKTGHGALAPVQWQQGKIGSVVDYCLEDVRLTKMLFDRIFAIGSIQCPKTGRELEMRSPLEAVIS